MEHSWCQAEDLAQGRDYSIRLTNPPKSEGPGPLGLRLRLQLPDEAMKRLGGFYCLSQRRHQVVFRA